MSKLFEITVGLTPDEDDYAFVEHCDLDDVLARALPLTPGIRRGDVIVLEEFGGYRNDGKLIYDGEKLIPFDDTEDEYGHLPREFTVNEIGSLYVAEVVEHNKLVWARFDNYTITRHVIKAQMGNVTYTIYRSNNFDGEFNPLTAQKIMAYGAFEYTDDPLVLEYCYTGESDECDDLSEISESLQYLSTD